MRPIGNMKTQDELYIKRIQKGETECFNHLVEHYSKPVFTLICRIVRNQEDAEELTQDVFLKIFRSLKDFQGNSLFSTWLYRVAYNTAVSHTRKKKQEFLYMEEQTIQNISDRDVDEAFEHTVTENHLHALHQAIDRLSPDERGIITLFYMEEKTVDELAEVTGLSSSNVKVKLHRIRKKLYLMLNNDRNYLV